MSQEFYIGQTFDGIYPPEAACWCNGNNAYIDEISDRRYEIKAVPEPLSSTEEQQRANRASDYANEVDPITAHIQRLRDKEQTEEVIAEIAKLIAERDEKIAAIKARYPYAEE